MHKVFTHKVIRMKGAEYTKRVHKEGLLIVYNTFISIEVVRSYRRTKIVEE